MRTGKELLVALAGQPNVGKSTVFNILTGLSQHVGNWPGKTVEKKEGICSSGEVRLRIVDLPGTYNLSAFSEEERIARDFIINEKPDVIVLIANASTLERSLYLLSELLLLESPVICALNMIDEAHGLGIRTDIDALRNSLGIPVVPMVATRNEGIKELIAEIVSLSNGTIPYDPAPPEVSPDHRDLLMELMKTVHEHVTRPYTARWMVTKFMEGDPDVSKMLEKILPGEKWNKAVQLLRKHEDSLLAVVHGRYDWIETVIRSSTSQFRKGQVLVTDRLDHLLIRPILGIPILLSVLAIVLLLTYGVGSPLQEFLDRSVHAFGRLLEPLFSGAPSWVSSLLMDGVIAGAGTVLTFIPILLIFFTFMAILEDVGYMARAAFVMDRFMHLIGLHGKSFLPMFFGFGCNVPAVLGARIVESKRARLLTIFLTPFVPCTARLAVLTLIAAAMFGKNAVFVTWILIAVNIVALGISGTLVSRLFMKGEPMPFIMELPLYRRPNFKTIGVVVWHRSMAFLKKAGTIILGFSVLIWVMSHFPGDDIEHSLLGWMGHIIEPFGKPIGLDWKMMLALIASFVAKENSIATLGVLYGVGEEGLGSVLPQVMTGASALSFLVVFMLFIPCAATSIVMKQEMGSWTRFLYSFLFMMIVSFGCGAATYWLASALGI